MNGREFIDFALLAPGVTIGDTTSGSTDVIVEPVTKLSFAGQNIHFNFIAVDGADDISTASGIQRGTPPQDSVQEFRVINTDYTTDYGRAIGGIVNIITKSGTNDFHGSRLRVLPEQCRGREQHSLRSRLQRTCIRTSSAPPSAAPFEGQDILLRQLRRPAAR